MPHFVDCSSRYSDIEVITKTIEYWKGALQLNSYISIFLIGALIFLLIKIYIY